MHDFKNFIGGEWVAGSLGTLEMTDPSCERVIGTIARSGADDVDRAVQAARTAFEGEWGTSPAFERGRLLQKCPAIILNNLEELAGIESSDTGKPISQARNDVRLAARYFEFYAGAADKLHGETIPYQNGFTVYTTREPFGVTGHIIPWNYPMQMFARTLAPALAAGNAVVIKPAEDACLSVLRLTELLAPAGFSPGTINVVTGTGEEAGAALSAHPGIDHLAFTGSAETGTLVMQTAAANHCPVLLELGGKSPQIVFADADLDAAIPIIVNAIIQNTGQTCSAGSRLLLHQSIAEKVIRRLTELFANLVVGPADTDPDVGPIISRRQLDRVRDMVVRAEENGARVLARADIQHKTGYFYPPTILANVMPDSGIANEEVFGPVLSVLTFGTEAEAVSLANRTPYGLTAAVWTRDVARAHRMVKQVRAGQVFVNGYGAGGGVELPFGGMKRSGFGREKGFEALRHVTTTKTVIIRHD